MPTTDTPVNQVIINRLTKTQYEGVQSPSNNELWLIDPEFAGGKMLATDANGGIIETTLTPSTCQTTGNLVTSVSSASTDTQYPSAKCLYDMVGDIESLLHNINSGS